MSTPSPKTLNVLGPLIKTLREKANWSLAEVSERFALSGFECSEERLAQIESQQEPIADFEVLIFERVFPNSGPQIQKFFAMVADERFGQL